jgi:glycosyltransferase involved in cell wall biosynthesis
MSCPLVSIIVPCFNQAQYLSEALDSVLNQTYAKWECIVVNDGSLDNTEEIVGRYLQKDSRFFYLVKENGGLSSARNAGIEKAAGKYVLPLDADDKIDLRYIELAVEQLEKDENLKIVYCKAEFFGDKNGIWELPAFSLEQLVKFNIIFCSAVYRRDDWVLTGGYDTRMLHGSEDWELWVSILKNGGSVICLPFKGFYYRIKEISMFRSMTDEHKIQNSQYVHHKHADFVARIFGNPIDLKHENDILKKENAELISYRVKLESKPIYKIYKILGRVVTSFTRYLRIKK